MKNNIELDQLNVQGLNRYTFVEHIQALARNITGITPPLDSQLTIRLVCGCQFMWADISLIEERSYYCFHGFPFINWNKYPFEYV